MLSTQLVSVELPDDLYRRIREVAERNERSVESVLRESLEVMFGAASMMPEELLALLEHYRDDQLWAVVYQRLAWPRKERLNELVARGKEEGLSKAEQEELEMLLDEVDSYTLVRSQALHLLEQHGQDVQRYRAMGA
ncbi:MAG: hypothetical protein JXB30_09365 [Anaerolineae bacterium]|nr:hypothetical protein [Anaerolineae bacterium]